MNTTTTETDRTALRCEAALKALGIDWSDFGYIIMDVAYGYAEPGYGSGDDVVYLGNWNPWTVGPDATWADRHPERVAAVLEAAGASLEWNDEWTICQDCFRAVRMTADCYAWRPHYMWVDDFGPVCAECVNRDPMGCLSGRFNDPTWAVTWSLDLSEHGFDQWEPAEPHTYETGWHPGQNDDPADVLADIIRRFPNAEVLFSIDSVGQFDARWTAWVRIPDDDASTAEVIAAADARDAWYAADCPDVTDDDDDGTAFVWVPERP